MRSVDELYEHFIYDVVAHQRPRTVVLVGLLFYPGVALLLPLVAGWSTIQLLAWNFLGVVLAGSVLLGWLVVQVQGRDRRHLLDWTTELRHLDAEEFEWLVGELYRRGGWTVVETGRQDGPDGNVDLRLSRAGGRRIVQCKRWTAKPVGVKEVREFAGTLAREGLRGTDGILVTLSTFGQQAQEEAKTIGIELIDGRDLHGRVEQARRAEPCPRCGAPMVFGRSPYGWWFRCVATGCPGKKDLGTEPAEAVELLTRRP